MDQRFLTPLIAVLLGAFAIAAGPSQAQITINPIEKITLKGKRGPKLTQPGFEAGEYSGFAGAMAMKRTGFGSKDFAKTDFQVTAPSLPTPVTAHCEGGQSKLVIAWITWKRESLTYTAPSAAAPLRTPRFRWPWARARSWPSCSNRCAPARCAGTA